MPEYDSVIAGDKILKTETGALRSSPENKGRHDLISVHGIQRLARHYENGVAKYGEDNWCSGLSMRKCIGSAIRHLFKYLGGDRSEDHLAAAVWNIFVVIDHEERIERGILDPKLNDLPPSVFTPDEFKGK